MNLRLPFFFLMTCCVPLMSLEVIDNKPANDEATQTETKIDESENFPSNKTKEPTFRVVLEPYYRTALSPVLLRPIKKINFRMGDRFQKGDVLIQMDTVSLSAGKDKAKAALEKAASEFNSKKELYNRDLSSFFEYKEAEAAVSIAKADLTIAEDSLSKGQMIAPYNGRVIDIMIEENEYPKENTQIIEIIDDHIIRAKFLLPARYLQFVKVGAPVDFYVFALGKKVRGKITRTGAVMDPTSSTIKIEAEIDNANGEIIPGMTGALKLRNLIREYS